MNMRLELTKQECRWLADLATKAKIESALTFRECPNRIFELRRDNMADLEMKLNAAIERQTQRERSNAR